MNQLLSHIESGLPESCHQLLPNLQEYFPVEKHLSIVDGIITYNDRVVTPLASKILSYQHYTQPTVVSLQCLLVLHYLSLGLASQVLSMPPAKIATTATALHHLSPVLHSRIQSNLCTPLSTSAVTSSLIKTQPTLYKWIVTVTGLPLNAPTIDRNDWSTTHWHTREIGLRWWTGIPIQHNTRLPAYMGCKPSAILCRLLT